MGEARPQGTERETDVREGVHVRVRVARTASVVTLDVSQVLTSSLKVAQAGLQPLLVQDNHAQKTYDRSVTLLRFHVPMLPYWAAAIFASAHHASRATSSSVRLTKTCRGQLEVFWLQIEYELKAHAGLILDHVEAMRALLHSLREGVSEKVPCHGTGGPYTHARRRWSRAQGRIGRRWRRVHVRVQL